MLQCFTCPVCFNEMENTDLVVFNQHIDKCLMGSAVDEGSASVDLDEVVSKEEKQMAKQDQVDKAQPLPYHAKASGSSSEGNMSLGTLIKGRLQKTEEGLYTSSSSAVAAQLGESSDFKTPFFKRFTNMNESRSLVPDETASMNDSGSIATQQTSHSEEVIMKAVDMKVSTLTCPVCNQAQDTDDLTLFNRHVDMCLNQEVLLEFREVVPPCGQSNAGLLGKNKGKCFCGTWFLLTPHYFFKGTVCFIFILILAGCYLEWFQ